jgi:hypothetical protein
MARGLAAYELALVQPELGDNLVGDLGLGQAPNDRREAG